jgi:segregation and condensation protein A
LTSNNVSYAVKLEQFEGPLDLLLDLIEKDKLDVSRIALATVTDGYLHYVEAHQNIPPAELADFLVVAAKLLLIKSQLLLPFLTIGEEEDAADDLEGQLRIYKEYVEAARVIEAMLAARRFMYARDRLPNVEVGFAPPKRFTPDHLVGFMTKVIARLEPVVKTPKATVERLVSIHEKIRHIRTMLGGGGRLSFREVLTGSTSRADVVVSFLALLELVKQQSVTVSQEGQFDDILIERLGAE